jgi:hypothetical protein
MALIEYDKLPLLYKAQLDGMDLVVTEVTAHVYMRIGTADLGCSKVEACELLKKRLMLDFNQKLEAVNWQALQYFRGAA